MKSFKQAFALSTNKERFTAVLLGLILMASCVVASAAIVLYFVIAAATRTTTVQFIVTPGSTLAPRLTPSRSIRLTTAAPRPTPMATQFSVAPGQCPAPYVVRPGDTVLGIATLCHVTVDDIIRANNLDTSASLRIGQELLIPAGGQAAIQPTPIPLNTPIVQPILSPSDTPSPQSTPPPSAACTIKAWLSDEQPAQNTDVSVFAALLCDGQGIEGAPMQAQWNYAAGPSECTMKVTDGEGVASCIQNIGAATVGFQVNIDVTIIWRDQAYQASVSFTPK